MIDLSGKVALITGGAAGIGRAAALTFFNAGARVVIVDIDERQGEETAELIRRRGGEALFMRADVSKSSEVANYARAAVEKFDRIDVFINNAAWEGEVKSIVDYDDDVFDRVIAINLRGVFLGLKHVLPILYRQGAGVVVNTSSIAGHVGSPGIIAYTASKHAVLGMTKTAALEGAKFGVRVNAVSPGAVETRMIRSLAEAHRPGDADAAMTKYATDSPNGRLAQPEEIANVMLFLASDLSNHISGQSFRIDGGRIMY